MQKLFLLTWFIVIVMLTLVSLRLPLAFTVLFVFVDIALALVYFGTANASTTVTEAGGIAVFAFVLVGMYLYMDAMSAATGGKTFPQERRCCTESALRAYGHPSCPDRGQLRPLLLAADTASGPAEHLE